MLPEIDELGQERLKRAKVAIIGLGGLGSSCALYLAAAGVGELVLIDGDTVETPNLQRQIIHSLNSVGTCKVDSAKERLLALNSNIKIHTLNHDITNDNLSLLDSEIDVLIDASDNYPTRYLLKKLSLKLTIPLVHASAIKFQGHITTLNLNAGSPYYECLFENKEHNEESCESQGVFPPIVGVIGSLQASEALKVLLGLQTLDGFYSTFNILNNKNAQYKLTKKYGCICS